MTFCPPALLAVEGEKNNYKTFVKKRSGGRKKKQLQDFCKKAQWRAKKLRERGSSTARPTEKGGGGSPNWRASCRFRRDFQISSWRFVAIRSRFSDFLLAFRVDFGARRVDFGARRVDFGASRRVGRDSVDSVVSFCRFRRVVLSRFSDFLLAFRVDFGARRVDFGARRVGRASCRFRSRRSRFGARPVDFGASRPVDSVDFGASVVSFCRDFQTSSWRFMPTPEATPETRHKKSPIPYVGNRASGAERS